MNRTERGVQATRRKSSLAVISAVALVGLGACSSNSVAPPPAVTTTPATPTTVAAAEFARVRLDWLVEQINRRDADPVSAASGFAPSFLAQIPIDQIVSVVGSVTGDATGWKVASVDQLGPTSGNAVIASAEGKQATIEIAVEPDGVHRITGLRIVPIVPEVFPGTGPVSGAVFDAALRPLGSSVGFGLYDVSDGACTLIHGVEPETPQPIASTFKLWILAALANEIEAGRASWDETVPISRALISTPDGEIAGTKPGTPVSLRRMAELMISVSDNSATDHLLHRLGRQTVEEAMRDAGVADLDRNVPLLSTRELFLLKRGKTVTANAYLALDTAGRRRALDETLATVSFADDPSALADSASPKAIDTIEWFASPLDECRTQLRLAVLADRPDLAPVADILRMNPGLPFGAEWTDVRFKGGSEAGVAFGSWRLARSDGRVFVLAGGVSNPTKGVDELRALATIAAGVRLL